MARYYNNNTYTVYLVGPQGQQIKVRSKQSIDLAEESHYDRYVSRGYLIKPDINASRNKTQAIQPTNTYKSVVVSRKSTKKTPQPQQLPPQKTPIDPNQAVKQAIKNSRRRRKEVRNKPIVEKKIVGRTIINTNVQQTLHNDLDNGARYPISNNIGVGILSYNRKQSLKRLIDSISKHTELLRTTVFISDDGSTDPGLKEYLNELQATNDFVVIKNDERIGVAGNTNRLLKCLSRFDNILLLNDDVEILSNGWDSFYFDRMKACGLHHMIFREPKIYGASSGILEVVDGIRTFKSNEKPQGAVLALTNKALGTCGFFNERFGLYGMEHVDWSQRVVDMNLQPSGFYDAEGSRQYFKLHKETSAVEHRSELLQRARETYALRTSDYIDTSVTVPKVSCVIPFRNFEREDAIHSVVNNIRAQRFPDIEIILAEQDSDTNINLDKFTPTKYVLAREAPDYPFNKSRAFNLGVSTATSEYIIMHDADTLAPGHYFQNVYDCLQNSDGCHFGKSVIYFTRQASEQANNTGIIDKTLQCERAVGYFEGGSLACKTSTYWKIGGFNEDYVGYGCFIKGNYVLTDRGYLDISTVSKTDKLLTHERRFCNIDQVRIREYSGDVFDVYIPGRLPIKGVTPKHPFLIDEGDYKRWVEAKDLAIGMRIDPINYVPANLPKYDFDDIANTDKSLNKFSIYDNMDAFCYLAGMYNADGTLQSPSRMRTIYTYLNENETDIAEHIEELVHSLNHNINVNYSYVKNGCREVRTFNSQLAKSIYAIAGKFRAPNKIVHDEFINSLTPRQFGYYMGGACDGDANHSNGSEKRIVYSSSSINLVMAYSGALNNHGIGHSVGKRKGGSFDGSSDYCFDICINREFEHMINSKYQKPLYHGSNSTGKNRQCTIYKIDTRKYDGVVYNFEVEDDKSYVVNGVVVHNCEDCDFYARLSRSCNWSEDRKYDLLHLWHSRVGDWSMHHTKNKDLEHILSGYPIDVRIEMQRNKLRQKYPAFFE